MKFLFLTNKYMVLGDALFEAMGKYQGSLVLCQTMWLTSRQVIRP